MNNSEYILEVLRIFHGLEDFETLIWYVSDDDQVSFTVMCNDEFVWGSADGEPLTAEDLPDLRKAIEDSEAVYQYGSVWAPLLWVARKRKMRPQGASYSSIDKGMWPLFNEAGPEREKGLGNPYHPGEYKKKAPHTLNQ